MHLQSSAMTNQSGFNWPLWCGFLLAIVAFITYPVVFVRFPATRDVPWATLLIFAIAVVLTFNGVRRASRGDSTRARRIIARVLATVSVLMFALFGFGFFVLGKRLPESHGAPQVGQKAPEFSLTDTQGKTVTLTQLLSTPIAGRAPKGALLVFYRGYW